MIGDAVSHYRILEKLDEGGMGVVYRARDERLGREVALKFLREASAGDSAQLSRFEREATAASALNHPHICAVYDVGRHEGRPFIVLELLRGETLVRRLAKGPLSAEAVIQIGVELTDALAAAHSEGIVHRDIKPGNVFITDAGRTKVLDFGVAKLTRRSDGASPTASAHERGDEPAEEGLTGTGLTVGTLSYMSPEQILGDDIDPRSDLFSVGVLLWELATGQKPFRGADAAEVRQGIMNRDPTPGTGFRAALPPPELEPILLKALEKDPRGRYQTAVEMRDDLERLRRRPSAGRRIAGSQRWRGHLLAAALFTILALASALLWKVFPQPSTPSGSTERIQSLVVLPLQSLSPHSGEDYLADGMTEALINRLSQVRSIRVISRTSAMAYKDTFKAIPVIARELGVDGVVEGSVQRSGARIRVTAQLIRADEERSLWSGSYEREVKDVLRLQGELARAIADEIRVTVTPAEMGRLERSREVDPEAHHLYLRGRYYWNKRTPASFQAALKDFQGSIDIDPLLAPSYAGMANTYVLLGSIGYDVLPPTEAMPRARAAAHRALEIEPGAEAHAALAQVAKSYEWDWELAEKEFNRALELNPGYPTAHQWLSEFRSCFGRHKEAIREARRALDLDPLSLVLHDNLAWRYYYKRDFENAAETSRSILEMDPTFAFSRLQLALSLIGLERYREAMDEVGRFGSAAGGAPLAMALTAYCHARLGETIPARAILSQLTESSARRYVPAYQIGLVHLALQEPDEALDWLEQAYEERSGALVFLRVEPIVDVLRATPRFQSLMRKVGVPDLEDLGPSAKDGTGTSTSSVRHQ